MPAHGPSPLPRDATGIGLRRSLLGSLQAAAPGGFDFVEAAPENWIGVGGVLGDALVDLSGRYPLVCHGLSLSLGGPRALDRAHVLAIRGFLETHRVPIYSEHLSACGDSRGQLYDLMPIPFTEEGVHHVARRIREVQDILGRRIAVENISYYAAPFKDMSELEFVLGVLEEADCDLLLDVNNIIVNATNHAYEAVGFLHALPSERIAYIHVAGHHDDAPDLKVDTHGAPVSDPVWSLLAEAYRVHGVRPTLLERDFNFPPFEDLLDELTTVRSHLAAARDGARHAA